MKIGCIICGGKVFTKYLNGSGLARCQACKLVINPKPPSKTELEKYYSNPHYYDYWGGVIKGQESENIKKEIFDYYFQRVEQFSKKGNYLDIGCASGYVLEVAQRYGFEPFGVEVSPQVAQIAKEKFNSNIFIGTIEKNLSKKTIPEDFFHLISFFDVLEHLDNPLFVLRKIRKCLVAEGLLLITTPDINSFSSKIMRKKWPHILDEHLTYFSKETLRAILDKSGFDLLTIEPAMKFHNYKYINYRFSRYPIPIITTLVKISGFTLPDFLKNKTFRLSFGELMAVARKKEA